MTFNFQLPFFSSSYLKPAQRRLFCLSVLVILIPGGCATTRDFKSIASLEPDETGLETVLMPLDVELSILTAGGLLEPKADWTDSAKKHILTAVEAQQREAGSRLIVYSESDENDPHFQQLAEIGRLHGAVGQSILTHEYVYPLPTKKGTFSWTLGTDVQLVRERYNADYALFIHIRDSYASAGRIVVRLAAAALGVGISSGMQQGFASLVDLRTGDIVWFNRLLSTTGDLRTEEPANKTVSLLLKGLPR